MLRFNLRLLGTMLMLLMVYGCSPAVIQQPDMAGDASTPAADATTLAGATTGGEEQTIGSDPASGRNRQVDFAWEEYCYSSEYQLQIAKDPEFTLIVLDTGAFAPASSMSPAAYYPAGGLAASPSSLTGWAGLEAGHTYYWRVRVRQAATGQYLRSPWSEVKSFTIEP